MPPGGGGSTPGNIVDGDGPRRRRRILIRRSMEIKNPANLKFEREVAELEARQKEEQAQMAAAIVGSLTSSVCYPYLDSLPDDHVQDGESTWNDDYGIRGTSAPLLLEDITQQGKGPLLQDSAKPPADDTDFLEGTFYKINSDKQKAPTRNKKSSKKHKKKKGKAKGRKQPHATEMQSEPPTEPSSMCTAATGGETLASSSSRVAVRVPQMEYSSSSSSSPRVKAKLIITPAVNSASSGNEKELSASSSNYDFKSFEGTSSYATATSSSVNDYAGSLSDARSERSLSASDSTDSRRLKKASGEGNKPHVHQSSSLAIGPGGSQEASLCSDYSRNDGDFQKVVSKKAAQKMKKMQRRLERPAPSSTMAASGSGPIITRELVPRAPFREVITIGHYINDDTFYGRKPNQKKGKYQKARSLSNLSKTGYTDGDNVSGSNTMLVIATVHQAKPRSSHHVTLEAIKETNSPSCLPKEGELKVTAPVGDGIQDTDSKAPSSDKPSSLGSLANSSCVEKEQHKKAMALVGGDTKDTRAPSSDKTLSLGHLDNPSCVDRKEQKKAMALVGGGTEDTRAPSSDKTSSLGSLANSSCVDREEQKKTVALVDGGTEDKDSRAPTSGKTSSLGHLVNSSCIDREEQKKKAMALVGDGTKERDSRAPPTADKTSSLGHLVNSSCVDREEQKNVMSPVGGDTKDTDSRAATSDKTLSLCHLAISSCADREEQKKKENRRAFSTRASSELDNIIKAANNAYEIQAASDVYMISGIHADIENFLHTATTPVIGQIFCTKSNIGLQDQRLWSVWSWYEEPECCGIEVQMQGKIKSIWPEFSTYFQPLLSAVQLFGQSGMSQNHSGLIFEYFELENPFSRPPIFTKIKQLRDGINLSGNPIFGDPKQLESVKLSDIHPASWFCVAWYPICQIPAAAGRCQASFLTYHSLGKLVPQTCPMDKAGGHDRIICPIVGLLGYYKDQGEKWFQLREQLRFKPTPNVSSETNHAELLNKRLRTLRQGASIMSKAVVLRASGEVIMNYHSDYEFFRSRSL